MSTFELRHLKERTWIKVLILADSHLSDTDMKRLYIMDSTTISLFKEILKGVGRIPKEGKRKGGIKRIPLSRPVRMFLSCCITARLHGTITFFLEYAMELPKGSIITFDKGCVDYGDNVP